TTIAEVHPSWSGLSYSVFYEAKTSDSTGAIGPNRYLEFVNYSYAIYDRSGHDIHDGLLSDLVPEPPFLQNITDPQIMWDPGSNRFYYSFVVKQAQGHFCGIPATVACDPGPWAIVVGFSKTASPQGPDDFCKATRTGFGLNMP